MCIRDRDPAGLLGMDPEAAQLQAAGVLPPQQMQHDQQGRQALGDDAGDGHAPVSYTHLDVYKRQAPGMVLTGTVRNVVDFGVFVDIGVHQDGLVHISQVLSLIHI